MGKCNTKEDPYTLKDISYHVVHIFVLMSLTLLSEGKLIVVYRVLYLPLSLASKFWWLANYFNKGGRDDLSSKIDDLVILLHFLVEIYINNYKLLFWAIHVSVSEHCVRFAEIISERLKSYILALVWFVHYTDQYMVKLCDLPSYILCCFWWWWD